MSTSLTDDHDGGPRRAQVPAAAAWLGGLGLVPFVGLSIASQAIEGDLKTAALRGLLAYGAVILSFLGGIHWGAAMTRSISQTDSRYRFPPARHQCRSLARRLDVAADRCPIWPCRIGARLRREPAAGYPVHASRFGPAVVSQASPTAYYDRRRRPHRGGVRPVKGLRFAGADHLCDDESLELFCPTGQSIFV